MATDKSNSCGRSDAGSSRVTMRATCVAAVLGAAFALSADDVPDMFIDCVQSKAGAQYVDTGIEPKSGTKVELDFAFLNSNPGTPEHVAGAMNASGKIVRPVGHYYAVRGYVGTSGGGRFTGNVSFKGKMVRYNTVTTFVSGGSTYVQDGVQIEDPPDATWSTFFGKLSVPDCTGYPLYLFAQNEKGTAAGFSKIALYGAKIWLKESGEWVLKRDYKPCLKDGRAGLYDEVSKTIFYSMSGTDLDSNVHVVCPTTTGGMTPGQQITNAVKQAVKGDVIYFKKGFYRFEDDEYIRMWDSDKLRVWSDVANLAFVGEDTSSRKTWEEGKEPVVIDANGARFAIMHGATGWTFTGLTVTNALYTTAWKTPGAAIGNYYGGYSCSNCVFRNNSGWRGGACGSGSFYDCLFKGNSSRIEVNQSAGGALYQPSTVKDCDFIDNHAQSSGAIEDGTWIENCTFKNNVGHHNGYNCGAVKIATVKSTILNCLFEGNTNGSDKTGGILRFEPEMGATNAIAKGWSCFVSNCTFKANYVNSYNGTAYGVVRSGASSSNDTSCCSLLVLEDCRFYDNWNVGGFGGALWAATARRCVFKGNHGHKDDATSWLYGDSAGACDLSDCDFSDGEIFSSSLTRCTIHDVTNRAVFYNGLKGKECHVTNCLIRNCRPRWAVVYQQKSAEFVNCTFAHNKIASGRYNYVYEYCDNTTNINCVYSSNTNASGNVFSVGVHTDDDVKTIQFRNCAFGPTKPSGLQYDAACIDVAHPRFNELRDPEHPYFEPRANSPLKDAGADVGFTADDLDLAGRKRLNGTVDIGCYESWLKPQSRLAISVW